MKVVPRKNTKRALEVKHEIQIIDRELYHLRELYRRYSRRMLRAGLAIWVGGVVVFFLSATLLIGVQSLTTGLNVWSSLLIVALAAPILISALFIRRLEQKQRLLEQRRKNLMERFEEAMLKRVERIVKKA